MVNQTTISLTKEQKENLEEVREFLRKKYGTASYGDAVIHLYRFWNQNKGKEKRDPVQSQNSTTEE